MSCFLLGHQYNQVLTTTCINYRMQLYGSFTITLESHATYIDYLHMDKGKSICYVVKA